VVTTVAETVEAAAKLMCPDHDVELQERPYGDIVHALRCPAEVDSPLSTSNRWCTRCGVRDASWISGMCDKCYREVSAFQKQAQQESHDATVAKQAVRDALSTAEGAGADETVAWLRVYLADLP
jgi:hypothetical protein